MSSNYLSYYSSYFGNAGSGSRPHKKCKHECKNNRDNKKSCCCCCCCCNIKTYCIEPCQTICKSCITCNPCVTIPPTTTQPIACPPHPITYITTVILAVAIPTDGIPIPPGSTTIPANTVTVITGYNPIPTTNVGGIILDSTNGQFAVPASGRYFVSGTLSFSTNGATGTITFYIYRQDGTTNIINLLAANTIPASANISTYNTVTTSAELNTGDRIFFAVTQNTGAPISTTTINNRFVITRVC